MKRKKFLLASVILYSTFACSNADKALNDPLNDILNIDFSIYDRTGDDIYSKLALPTRIVYIGDDLFEVDGDTIETKLIFESSDSDLDNCELRSSFRRFATTGKLESDLESENALLDYYLQVNYYRCKSPEVVLLLRSDLGSYQAFYESNSTPADLSTIDVMNVPSEIIENFINVYRESMLNNDAILFASVLNRQFGSGYQDSVNREAFIDAWKEGDQSALKWTKIKYKNHSILGNRLHVYYYVEGLHHETQKSVTFNRHTVVSFNKSFKVSYIYDYIEDQKVK